MVARYVTYLLICLTTFSSNTLCARQDQFKTTYFVAGKATNEISTGIKLLQRQLLSIQISITSTNEFSYLKFNENINNDFKIEFRRLPVENTDQGLFTYSALIYIWPLVSKTINYSPGSIKLMLSGRAVNAFNIPRLKFDIRNLPEYLPPGFPVGKISVKMDDNRLLPILFTQDYVEDFVFTVESTGIHPSMLPEYTSNLYSDKIDTLRPSYEDSVLEGSHDYSHTRVVRFPSVIDTTTVTRFNDLKVSYFNPASSKIESYYFIPPVIISLSRIIKILILIILVYLVVILSRLIFSQVYRIHKKRVQWSAITNSQDARTFRNNLLLLTPQFEKPHNLSDWAGLWGHGGLSEPVFQLNAVIYSENSGNTAITDFLAVKNNIIRTLEGNIPVLYHLFNT